MIPLIDKKQTGINLRRIMDECGRLLNFCTNEYIRYKQHKMERECNYR